MFSANFPFGWTYIVPVEEARALLLEEKGQHLKDVAAGRPIPLDENKHFTEAFCCQLEQELEEVFLPRTVEVRVVRKPMVTGHIGLVIILMN